MKQLRVGGALKETEPSEEALGMDGSGRGWVVMPNHPGNCRAWPAAETGSGFRTSKIKNLV